MRHRRTRTVRGSRRARAVAAGSVVVLVLSAAVLAQAAQGRLARPPEPATQRAAASSAVPTVRAPTVRAPTVRAPTVPAPSAPQSSARDDWTQVLALLDRRRAQAYAAAEPGLLRAVYVPGSPMLRRDRAVLAAYAARDLRVRGLRMRVESVRVHRSGRRRVVLRVRDRVAGGVVVGRRVRRPLASDLPSTRLITLRRGAADGWRIVAVRRP